MEKMTGFDTFEKDFKLDKKQRRGIVDFVHSLHCNGASRKLVYNEITTNNYTRKQLDFAFVVMGFYEAVVSFGVEIRE